VHLSFRDIGKTLKNLKRSKIEYVVTTTFPATTANSDIVTGDWRPLNVEAAPLRFPKPIKIISEGTKYGAYGEKCMGVWRTSDLSVREEDGVWLIEIPRKAVKYDTKKQVNVASVPLRSPFRYPGGKTWLVPQLRSWLLAELSEPLGCAFECGPRGRVRVGQKTHRQPASLETILGTETVR